MLINIARRGNIATPTVYIFVFVNEVFNKCYTNISVMTKTKSIDDTFCAHIAP